MMSNSLLVHSILSILGVLQVLGTQQSERSQLPEKYLYYGKRMGQNPVQNPITHLCLHRLGNKTLIFLPLLTIPSPVSRDPGRPLAAPSYAARENLSTPLATGRKSAP